MRSLALALATAMAVSPTTAQPSPPRIAFVDEDAIACRDLSVSVAFAKPKPKDPLLTKSLFYPAGVDCIIVATGWSIDVEREVTFPFEMTCARIRKVRDEPFCRWIASAHITQWLGAPTH